MQAEIQNSKDQLFRYRKGNEFSLDELENSYIYFPSSSELNDPFDVSHNTLSLTKEDAEIEKLYNQILEDSSNELTRSYIKKTYENNLDIFREFVIDGIKNIFQHMGLHVSQ